MDTPCQSVRGHLCNTYRVEVIGDCVNCDLYNSTNLHAVGSSHSQDGVYT